MKQNGIGFYTTGLSFVAGVVALVFYMINAKTDYFANLGVSPVVVGCTVVAVVAQLVLLVLSKQEQPIWMDLAAVAAPVLLMVAFINLTGSRVNGIASIMTFENNAQTMSDLTSAIVSMAALLIACLIGIVSSYFNIRKA
ncbi:MAG: hypothetical protein SOY27_04800 [Fournierella sp.]|uniref:hypothetical protein n=1 Tax=Allofournierella sp. TaxID=1940256 RepID=UPI002A838394|nr:hypothetical protein [Fournierella sp.]MDY4166793.1 hypothetical protein [Fournierella sp.]